MNGVTSVADGIANDVNSWCDNYYSDKAKSVALMKAAVAAENSFCDKDISCNKT